jgi:hypothetical protein
MNKKNKNDETTKRRKQLKKRYDQIFEEISWQIYYTGEDVNDFQSSWRKNVVERKEQQDEQSKYPQRLGKMIICSSEKSNERKIKWCMKNI